jgi:DNA-binding CsgD family transcriptional regulator
MTAYVDPIAVERAVLGDRVRLTKLERRAAVQRLTAAGESARIIAERVGISSRTGAGSPTRTGGGVVDR